MKYARIENNAVTAIRSDSHPAFRLPTPWMDISGRAGPIGTGSPYDSVADTFGPPPPDDEENQGN